MNSQLNLSINQKTLPQPISGDFQPRFTSTLSLSKNDSFSIQFSGASKNFKITEPSDTRLSDMGGLTPEFTEEIQAYINQTREENARPIPFALKVNRLWNMVRQRGKDNDFEARFQYNLKTGVIDYTPPVLQAGKSKKPLFIMGEPGTGKTMLTQAIANELELPFIRFLYNKSDAISIVGNVANSEEVLREAELLAPCVVYIDEVSADEIDIIGKDYLHFLDEIILSPEEKRLNLFRSTVQGLNSLAGVTVIGTVSEPLTSIHDSHFKTIEMPVLKSGEEGDAQRIDLIETVFRTLEAENLKNPLAHLSSQLSAEEQVNLGEGEVIDVKAMARFMDGASPALIAQHIRNAVEWARNEGSAYVTMAHLTQEPFYIGLGADRVKELFRKARENQPALLYIDEINDILPEQKPINK